MRLGTRRLGTSQMSHTLFPFAAVLSQGTRPAFVRRSCAYPHIRPTPAQCCALGKEFAKQTPRIKNTPATLRHIRLLCKINHPRTSPLIARHCEPRSGKAIGPTLRVGLAVQPHGPRPYGTALDKRNGSMRSIGPITSLGGYLWQLGRSLAMMGPSRNAAPSQ
jgi:hypothetical protein